MIDTPERIQEISEKIGYPKKQGHALMFMEMNGVKDFEHVLVSRMEEDIVNLTGGIRYVINDSNHSVTPFGSPWDIIKESRLEATYAAWQEVKEEQQ